MTTPTDPIAKCTFPISPRDAADSGYHLPPDHGAAQLAHTRQGGAGSPIYACSVRHRIQLPGWVVAVIDPAQGYMRRQSGRRHPARHPGAGTRAFGPLADGGRGGHNTRTENALLRLDIERLREERRRERAARVERVMHDHEELLEHAAHELARNGKAQVNVPTGEIYASVTRFRWGDSVLEIEGRRRRAEKITSTGDRMSAGVMSTSRARVPRNGVEAEVALRYLADFLAGFYPAP